MAIDRETLLSSIRATRDAKLERSDIDMIRAVEDAASFAAFVTDRSAWAAYRQALRDYPDSIPEGESIELADIPAMPLSPLEQAAADAAAAEAV